FRSCGILYVFELFVGISVKNGNRKSSKGERSECIYPCSFFCCHLAFVNRRNSKILKLFDTFQRYDPTHCVGGYGQSPLFFIFVSVKMLVKIIKKRRDREVTHFKNNKTRPFVIHS